MGLIDSLLRRAGVDAAAEGGLHLIAEAHVDAVLDAAEATGVLVVGIEGFRRLDGEIEPVMDAILDLSELSDPVESVRESRRFLSELQIPGLVYDLSVVAPAERGTP